jgi:hypothetical protein
VTVVTAAQPRKASSLAVKVADFNKRVEGLVLSHGAFPRASLKHASRVGVLLPWQDYVAMLGPRSVTVRADSELHMRWQDLFEGVQVEQRAHECGTLELPIAELSATTVPEFTALLNRLRRRAKGGVTGLAKRSGISRSQIYAITDVTKPALPTRSDQVRAFLEGCGLPEYQVSAVEQVWADLNENRAEDASLSGEQKLLSMMHRVMVELDGMTDKDPHVQAMASANMINGALGELPARALADPEMVAMVLEDVAVALRARARSRPADRLAAWGRAVRRSA